MTHFFLGKQEKTSPLNSKKFTAVAEFLFQQFVP